MWGTQSDFSILTCHAATKSSFEVLDMCQRTFRMEWITSKNSALIYFSPLLKIYILVLDIWHVAYDISSQRNCVIRHVLLRSSPPSRYLWGLEDQYLHVHHGWDRVHGTSHDSWLTPLTWLEPSEIFPVKDLKLKYSGHESNLAGKEDNDYTIV